MKINTPLVIDPGAQAIFDAIEAYMTANNLPSCNVRVGLPPNTSG